MKLRSKNILVNFIESKYVLVLLGILFIIIMVYITSNSNKQSENIYKQQENLERLSSTILDHNFSEIEKITQIISYNNSIIDFINMKTIESGTSEIQLVINAKQALNDLRNLDNLIKDIYVYSKENDYLLSYDNAFFDANLMYESLIKFNDLNYLQWKKEYLLNKSKSYYPSTIAKVGTKKTNVITYGTNLVRVSTKSSRGRLLILLNSDCFTSVLAEAVEQTDGLAFILDQNDKVVASYNTENIDISNIEKLQGKVNINNKFYYINTVHSDVDKLRYVYAVPYYSIINMKAIIITIIIIIVMVIIVILNIISLKLLNDRERKWSELQKATGKQKLDYEDLISHINDLLDVESIEAKPFTRDTLFRRLIHGEQTLVDEFANSLEVCEDTKIKMVKIVLNDLDKNHFTKESLDDINFTRMVSERVAKDLFKQDFYIYMDYSFAIWIILCGNDFGMINQYYSNFSSLIPISTTMLVSDEKSSILLLEDAIEECKKIESILPNKKDNSVVTFDTIKNRCDTYELTKENKDTIIESIRGKDLQSMEATLETIEKANFINKDLSYEENNLLLIELTKIARIAACDNTIEDFSNFGEATNCLTSLISMESVSKEDTLKSKIIDEVEKNYSSYSFNLAQLATNLNVRENYLYHFVSTRFETTFAKYLESYRLQKAVELLENSSCKSIGDIANSCGYANNQTFRRAFKKRYKILPSDYNKL